MAQEYSAGLERIVFVCSFLIHIEFKCITPNNVQYSHLHAEQTSWLREDNNTPNICPRK